MVGNGTGFLFDSAGHALTNFHVVHGVSKAVAVFSGREKEEIDIELVEVYSDLDLAVLKLDLGDAAGKHSALKLSTEIPQEGMAVWSAGFPMFGFTVNRGVISGLRKLKELPEESQPDGISPESSWVQTDCTINFGNSGGPLVDKDGNVIGINTWVSRLSDDAYFALSSSDAAKKVSSLPAQPITFAVAMKRFPANTPKWDYLGELPKFVITHSVKPDKVTSSARALGAGFLKSCSRCDGTGAVDVRKHVGSSGTGLLRKKIFRTVAERCDACRGTGATSALAPVLFRLASNFAIALASLDSTDAELEQVLVRSRADIVEGIRKNPSGLIALNDRSKAIVGLSNPSLGTPVVGIGRILLSLPSPDGKSQNHVVALSNSTRQMLIAEPILSEPSADGLVFIGGVNAGSVRVPGAENLLVLRNGFVMSVESWLILPR